MKDFLSLNSSSYKAVSCTAAAYLGTEVFKEGVRETAKDPRALARLTLNLLDHIALDPREGTRLEDFVSNGEVHCTVGGGQASSEDVWFCLQLNRTSNFIGSFSLPPTTPEYPLLLAAIQRNLGSKMFKAAAMHRRFERKFVRRSARYDAKARKAYQAVIDQAMSNPLYVSRSSSPEARAYREQVLSVAQAAHHSILVPLRDQLQLRGQRLGRASFSPDYQGSYTDMLVAFAVRYLTPLHQDAIAEAL